MRWQAASRGPFGMIPLRHCLREQRAKLVLGVRQAAMGADAGLNAGQAEHALRHGVEQPDDREKEIGENNQRQPTIRGSTRSLN